MASCKNCVHFSVCKRDRRRNRPDEETPPNWCKHFMNTADVEEVVRCKDCAHKVDFKGRVMCNRNALKIDDEWCGLTATDNEHYCSYGERKIEESNSNYAINLEGSRCFWGL